MVSTNESFIKNIERAFEHTKKHPESVNARLGLMFKGGDMDKGVAEFGYRKKEEDLNTYGEVHGGTTASILDTCMGVSAMAACGRFVSTTDMSISYLRPLLAEEYSIKVSITKLGKVMIRTTASIIDNDTGKACATSMGSYFAKGEIE